MKLLNRRLHSRPGAFAKILVFLTIILAASVHTCFIPGGAGGAQAQVAGDSLYAILYSGYSSYYIYRNTLSFAFKTLINDFGYTKSNILVLWHNGGFVDLDGDGFNDVDFSATTANMDTVFARLGRVMTSGDILFFFATDHGRSDPNDYTRAGLAVYQDVDTLWEEELVSYIDALDTPARVIKKILLFNTCYAGGMMPELKQLDGPLMIASAAGAGETAYSHYAPCDTFVSCDYNGYAFHWFSALHGSTPDGSSFTHADYDNDGYVSIGEAARFAKENDEYAQETASPKEHPLYYDKDCISGKSITLNGPLPYLTGTVAFLYSPCHEPWPCRWHSWGCDYGSGMAVQSKARASIGSETVATTMWVDPVPSPGETTYVYAKVYNEGDTPLTSAEVKFYFSDPTLSLIYPQSGLNYIGSKVIPVLGPKETLTVGPMPFVPPQGGNYFGEPYWTFMATAEHPDSPVESGWLTEDDHVAATNRFEIAAFPEEPKTIHLAARNSRDVPVKALLSIDESNLPSGWTCFMNPAAGDTILLDPHSWTTVELILTGTDGPTLEGSVDISMDLNTTSVKTCTSCGDSLCGGFIGTAGGCSVKLKVESGVGVAISELKASSTPDAITLTWLSKIEGRYAGFNVYRTEKEVRNFQKINDVPITGAGELSYVDRTAIPGKTYLYKIGIVGGDSEKFSREVEASIGQKLELKLLQNYPNPFNPTTTISFILPEKGYANLSIFDLQGKLIKTLADGTMHEGVKEYLWDGTDSRGNPVGSGIYFYRLKTGKKVLTKKMVLLK